MRMLSNIPKERLDRVPRTRKRSAWAFAVLYGLLIAASTDFLCSAASAQQAIVAAVADIGVRAIAA